jgi:hypothetical protein
MIDPTPQETQAIYAALKLVAETMEEIGWETRLLDLTEAQALLLIEVAVDGFQDAMAAAKPYAFEEVPF